MCVPLIQEKGWDSPPAGRSCWNPRGELSTGQEVILAPGSSLTAGRWLETLLSPAQGPAQRELPRGAAWADVCGAHPVPGVRLRDGNLFCSVTWKDGSWLSTTFKAVAQVRPRGWLFIAL